MDDFQFEVTPEDCRRWARSLREIVDATPGDSEENRMRILCAYLLYCFADTISEEMPGGTKVTTRDPLKELN